MRLKTTWKRHGCFGSVAICDFGLARSGVRHAPKRDVEVAVRIICLPVASTFRSIIKTEVTHVKTRHVAVVMCGSNYTRCVRMRSPVRPLHCAVVVSLSPLSMLTEGFLAYFHPALRRHHGQDLGDRDVSLCFTWQFIPCCLTMSAAIWCLRILVPQSRSLLSERNSVGCWRGRIPRTYHEA
jgi:hypothetical protein